MHLYHPHVTITTLHFAVYNISLGVRSMPLLTKKASPLEASAAAWDPLSAIQIDNVADRYIIISIIIIIIIIISIFTILRHLGGLYTISLDNNLYKSKLQACSQYIFAHSAIIGLYK